MARHVIVGAIVMGVLAGGAAAQGQPGSQDDPRLGATGAIAPTPAEGPGVPGTLVVLNKNGASVTLIDGLTGGEVAVLPTGEGPHEAAVSPDGRTLVVCDYGDREHGRTLTVIDLMQREVVRTIDLGRPRRPHGVQFLGDGRRVAVTAELDKALLIVDVERGEVERELVSGQDVTHMVVLAPDGSRAFVSSIGSGTISAFDLETGSLVGHVETGPGAEGIDISPDGREVWVGNRAADSLTVVDARTLEVLATLDAPGFPIRVKFTPDGARVLVSCARSGEVLVFDAAARELAATVELAAPAAGRPPVPIGIQPLPGSRRAVVSLSGRDAVAVLDIEAAAVVGTLPTGSVPDGLAFSPAIAVPLLPEPAPSR